MTLDNVIKCGFCRKEHVYGKDTYITLKGNLLTGSGGGLLGHNDWEVNGIPSTNFCKDTCFIPEMANVTYQSEEVRIASELICNHNKSNPYVIPGEKALDEARKLGIVAQQLVYLNSVFVYAVVLESITKYLQYYISKKSYSNEDSAYKLEEVIDVISEYKPEGWGSLRAAIRFIAISEKEPPSEIYDNYKQFVIQFTRFSGVPKMDLF